MTSTQLKYMVNAFADQINESGLPVHITREDQQRLIDEYPDYVAKERITAYLASDKSWEQICEEIY